MANKEKVQEAQDLLGTLPASFTSPENIEPVMDMSECPLSPELCFLITRAFADELQKFSAQRPLKILFRTIWEHYYAAGRIDLAVEQIDVVAHWLMEEKPKIRGLILAVRNTITALGRVEAANVMNMRTTYDDLDDPTDEQLENIEKAQKAVDDQR